MAEPFSETARVARSISEPLTKAERETLATAAATAAADATRKAGRGESMQTSAARSAEEAVRQSAQTRSEEGSPPPSGEASGEAREAPPQHVARDSADAKSADYERDKAAEASRDWRHSFGEQQRHGLPTKHTGSQREYGRE